MKTTEILHILKQIKELYSSIKQNSILLANNFSDQMLEGFVKTREELLKEIYQKEAEYSLIKTDNRSASGDCLQTKKEIRELIISITSLDTRISETISKNMKSIRQELSGLYSSSKAVLAYSNQRRT